MSCRVLLVEPHYQMYQLYQTRLQKGGHEVRRVLTFSEAVPLLTEFQPDVLLVHCSYDEVEAHREKWATVSADSPTVHLWLAADFVESDIDAPKLADASVLTLDILDLSPRKLARKLADLPPHPNSMLPVVRCDHCGSSNLAEEVSTSHRKRLHVLRCRECQSEQEIPVTLKKKIAAPLR